MPNTPVSIYDFAGNLRCNYEVEIEKVRPEEGNTKAAVTHKIFVIDRSGSMSWDMEDLKEMLIKVLTISEYKDADMVITVISYSTRGDVTLHFERVPVADVMATNSSYIKEIRRIRATCLTCISQAMIVAEGLVKDDEMTAITLHSDGYANDPSPGAERRELQAICGRLSEKNVFVNTIAYSDWSDFVLLSEVANTVSGNCVKAKSAKEVYDAFEEACTTLASGAAAAIEIPANGAEYVVYASKEPRKVIGSGSDMSIKGVTDAGGVVFRFRPTDKANPEPSGRLESGEAEFALLAMARAKLAAGELNTAKFAMASSMNATLCNAHARALTSTQIAAMAADLEETMFENGGEEDEYLDSPGLSDDSASVIEVVGALHRNRSDIMLNLPALKSGYRRRGLKRLPGKRDDDGNIVSPWVDTEYVSDAEWVQMGTFEINRNSATVNLLVTRQVKLVNRETREEIPEVAGVLLNSLSTFNNYTVVGDGELNVDKITVRFANKKAFQALADIGAVEGSFAHDREYVIDLASRSVCPFWFEPEDLKFAFAEAAQIKVVLSALNAMMKDGSAEYTPEQVEELKRHCLSTSLYLNYPTVNEYEDLNQAITDGIVDTRTSYKVDVGTTKILNVGKFKSANAFLERRYEVTVDGNKVKKPKMTELLRPGVSLEYKKLSSRSKVDAAEMLQMGIFDEIVGNNVAVPILNDLLGDKLAVGISHHDPEAVEEAIKVLNSKEDTLWREKISPLVFFIGSTGLLPDSIDAKAMTADELTAACPDITLSKAEQEGTFFVFGDTVISVYSKAEYFSTGRGSADQAQQQAAATATA